MATIIQSARAFGLFHVLLEMLEVGGLGDALRRGPYTLFAPLDEAFLEAGVVEPEWMWHLGTEACATLAVRHLVPGFHTTSVLAEAGMVRTMGGDRLDVRVGSRLTVAGAQVLQGNLLCDNGVLHVIDRVLVTVPAKRPVE